MPVYSVGYLQTALILHTTRVCQSWSLLSSAHISVTKVISQRPVLSPFCTIMASTDTL